MREDIAGTFVFDAGVLIELLLHSEKGVFRRDALLNNLIFEKEIGGAIKGSVDGKSQRYECHPEGGIYAILRIYSKSIGYTQC